MRTMLLGCDEPYRRTEGRAYGVGYIDALLIHKWFKFIRCTYLEYDKRGRQSCDSVI